jgi:hypothetical protein
MVFIDTGKLPTIERLPGWRGRYFNSPSITFAHYEFDAGSSIHEHFHPQEEVYHIIEGELELAIRPCDLAFRSRLCWGRAIQYPTCREGDLKR